MGLTLFRFNEELVLAQVPKHFLNVFDVVLHIVQIDQDVIEVYYHADIEHICEDQVTNRWKAARALVRPKGITCHS